MFGSLINLAFYLGFVLTALGVMLALLPSDAVYPFPPEIAASIATIVHAALYLDRILPIHEFLTMLKYMAIIMLISRVVWPSAMLVFKSLRTGP